MLKLFAPIEFLSKKCCTRLDNPIYLPLPEKIPQTPELTRLEISDENEKRQQEINSLKRVGDSFKKIVVVKDNILPWHDDNGILYIGIEQFSLDEKLWIYKRGAFGISDGQNIVVIPRI